MIEGVGRVAERKRAGGESRPAYLCILCGRLREIVLSLHGNPHAVSICRECADRLTHAAPPPGS